MQPIYNICSWSVRQKKNLEVFLQHISSEKKNAKNSMFVYVLKMIIFGWVVLQVRMYYVHVIHPSKF